MLKLRAILVDDTTFQYQIINQIEGKKRGVPEVELEQGYDGNFYAAGHVPTPPPATKEEQSTAREIAYQQEVDPITCHISRLMDEEQTDAIKAEIEALKAERAEKVAAIKAQYPYPEAAV